MLPGSTKLAALACPAQSKARTMSRPNPITFRMQRFIANGAEGTMPVRQKQIMFLIMLSLWDEPCAVEAERQCEEVGFGEGDGAGGIAERGDGDPIGEVGGGFDGVIETGVAAQ